MDSMKEFITSTAFRYYDSPKLEINQSNSNTVALENFINNAQCLTLSAVVQNLKIEYQTEVSRGENGSLIFYKSTPVSLESENAIQFLGITALPSNPVESLYLTLHHVYGPLLQSDSSVTVDPKIQEMLSHLEAGLRSIASGKDGGPSLMVVLTVDDETDYWQTLFAESKTRKQRDMAEAFISILQPLSQEVRSIDMVGTSEIQEAMESAGGFLDDLWRHSNYIYPQKRMAHLMDVIGNACITKLQEILSPLDVWGSDSTVIKTLTECSSAATAWLSACQSLTQKYWPNHSLHAWEGKPHVPRYLNMFQERLKEIADVRSVHLQLTKLLSPSEQDDLKASKIFQPFHGLNLWQCTPSSNVNWLKSKSYFERLLKPAEDRIAEKLRPKLVSSSAKQMLHEFGRYTALIERPTVHAALKKEREIFMSTLGTLLKDIETQVADDKSPIENEVNMQEISPLVQHIQWTKYMMGRVMEIEKTTDHLLNDLDGCALVQKRSVNLQNELRQLQTQLYEDWTRDLQMELSNKSLILSPESPVVEFSADNNLMRVTFNPRLVSLERDVRHMSSLGFSIPSAVKEAVNHAAQFMGHARALQQVAAFHNTQGDRMIVSQRPMMLQAAVQLASLVKEQSAVPWKNIEAVSRYVDKLKEAESKLVEQNTYLTSQHNAMRNIVMTLMETDLLQKQSEWKKKIREMRDIIDKVETRGFSNNRAWKIHWDIQLYKALEHQYRSTLINPLPHLPVIRVELLFRHQEVQLQPPLEELRANSYSQLRKLVSLPSHFIGLQSSPSDSESIFQSILKRNNWLIAGALEEVERTLKTVVNSVQRWRKWGALGTVDMDSLCDVNLSDPADWDRNFKDCKAFGQAIAKLPMEDEHVEWIWISSASLRSELEAHNRRYWLALTTSLQTSVQRDTGTLETYIMSANKALTQIVPKNAKELASANEEFLELKEKEPQMTTLLEGLRKKQSMVRAWGGERTRPLEYLTKQWDNLLSHMQNHEQLIIHQAESVKTNLMGEWANLNESVEVWHSRWSQNKPKADQFADVSMSQLRSNYQLLADASQSWSTFKNNKENMENECGKFNLKLEEKSLWTDVEKKMLDDAKFWEPFKQFDEDLSSLSSQEWFLFQKKLHLLDELVSDWSQKLEPYTAITLFIQKEINQYKDILPSLKHLRGADFTERHWREIFSLLDIVPKPTDTIVLGDFLNVAGNIKVNAKTLQKIWTAASHEAVVRGAVAELELWLAGARLVIVKHRDAKGQEVPIIKDYKDILAKVEEYQSLAGSARMAGGDSSGGVGGGGEGSGSGSDQLSIWESRLAHLHSSLTSLAHVQRK